MTSRRALAVGRDKTGVPARVAEQLAVQLHEALIAEGLRPVLQLREEVGPPLG